MASFCCAFCVEKERKKRREINRARQMWAAKKNNFLTRKTLTSVLEAKGVDAKGVKCQTQPWFAIRFPRSETKVWLLSGPWALSFANTKKQPLWYAVTLVWSLRLSLTSFSPMQNWCRCCWATANWTWKGLGEISIAARPHSHLSDVLRLHRIGISEVKQVWVWGAVYNNSFLLESPCVFQSRQHPSQN